MEESYYDVLGVPRDASQAEIRKAYIRMVRKHPPERDKEGFQRIQAAYEVLKDEKSRREYDEQWFEDPVSRELMARAREMLEEGEDGVEAVLKRLLVRNPESAVARDMLTRALQKKGELQQALKEARRTIRMDPDNAVYRYRLADILEDLGKGEEAIRAAREALERDREHAPSLILLARCLQKTGRTEEAVRVLREAIEADGVVDFNDFIYFRTLCQVYVAAQDWEALDRVRDEIRKIVPPDGETRAFVAWSFYVDAIQLAELGMFEPAVRFVDDAMAVDPSLPGLKKAKEDIHKRKKLMEEARELEHDTEVIEVLRRTLFVLVLGRTVPIGEEGKNAARKLMELLFEFLPAIGFPWEEQRMLLERKYPTLSEEMQEVFDNFDNVTNMPSLKIFLQCPSCGHGALGEVDLGGMLGVSGRRIYICPKCRQKMDSNSRPVGGFGGMTGSGSGPCAVMRVLTEDRERLHVHVLRSWRDAACSGRVGRWMVLAYYRVISPLLVEWMERSPGRRGVARFLICRLGRRVRLRVPTMVRVA